MIGPIARRRGARRAAAMALAVASVLAASLLGTQALAGADDLEILTVAGNLYDVPTGAGKPARRTGGLAAARLLARTPTGTTVLLGADGTLQQLPLGSAQRATVRADCDSKARALVVVGNVAVVVGARLLAVRLADGHARDLGRGDDLRWVGAGADALVALTDAEALVTIELTTGARREVRRDPSFRALKCLAAVGDRWYGVSEDGALLRVPLDGSAPSSVLASHPGLRLCELLAGRAGRLWVVSYWGNLYRVDPSRRSIRLVSSNWINARWMR